VPQVFKCTAASPHFIIRARSRLLARSTLLLPHAVSSLMILRDRGDVSDSQKGIQTMPLSTSATFMVLMTTHLSEGLVRDVHAERHGVATVPPRAHRTRLPTRQQSTQLICVLNLRARMVTHKP